MNQRFFIVGFLGIALLLGSIPFSISELEEFSDNANVVSSSDSSTQGPEMDKEKEDHDKKDHDKEDHEKVKEAHEKITKFMLQKNKLKSSSTETNTTNDDLPQIAFDEQLPVFVSFVNETSKELVIGLDYNSANKTYAEYESKILDVVGYDVPFKLITGFVVEEACTSQEDVCRPIWGGIQMSGPTQGAATLTLPFVTNDDKIGFIISGHSVDGSSSANVFQPEEPDLQSDHVGSVITNPSGTRASDSAFVERLSSKTLAQEIFKSSGQSYTVIGTKTSSQTPLFTTIHKVGITTGETSAGVLTKNISITGGIYSTLTNQVTSGYASAQGDSGAPVFEKDTGDDVYFIGVHVGRACFSDFPPTIQIPNVPTEQDCIDLGGNYPAYYSPWEGIQADLNLVDFDDICSPTLTGDWTITQDCIMISDATIADNVIVNSPARLTIPDGITLDIDFANQHLMIKNGASVLIKDGGKIT